MQSNITPEFLSSLTNEELAAEYNDRHVEYENKSNSVVWKICDRYEEETGIFTDIQEMQEALTDEMIKRFLTMTTNNTKLFI